MRYVNKANVVLFAVAAACFTLAGCATGAETTAAIVATIGAAGAFINELGPILSPEMQAKLTAAAGSIDGTVQATQQAVGVIADAIAAFKVAVSSQAGATSAALAQASHQIAELPGREELYLVGAGGGAGGTLASRLLSAMKHGAVGKMPPQA